ncbi:MAG: helix-turn-helix domain-containing protein [Nitrincola lacisaponensis]|uniref:helix-turn-helix domain-containing protein n=1 Tax=Nitrincola lacisaponensis TaxID=267850 RepID=UPI00391C428A
MSKSQTHSQQDWHRQDILAAVRKRGITVAELARQNGYNNSATFYNVFKAPYPKVERIIAKFLGLDPSEIWPTRYQSKSFHSSTRETVNQQEVA